MIRRILFTSAAAAALLAGVPALAAEHGAPESVCSCCSDGSMHHPDHALREQARAGSAAGGARQPAASEDPDVRNQSFGG